MNKRLVIIVIVMNMSLSSCFEIIDIDIKNIPEETFPYIEVIYNSKSGWKTIFDKTKVLNNKHEDTVELEYFQLFENGKDVYSWSKGMNNSFQINYRPEINNSYSLKVKLMGYDEIQSDDQIFNTKPSIDTCYLFDEVISCNWMNQDLAAGYYVDFNTPSGGDRYSKRPDVIRNSGSNLPEIMSYTFDKPIRDSVLDITLNRLSNGLINFYNSIEQYQQSYDDGITDPPSIYSNFSDGYGVFGLVSQSDTVRIKIM